jgi:hypothetical protein
MNSLSLELISGADSLTRLSGTNHFEVVGKTIRRAYGVYSIPPNPAVQAEASNSITASSAGSVQLNGIVSEVKFKWTGYGVEGIGMDGVHMLVSGLCNIV